jgi:anti-sigma factor RsiW
MKCSEFRKSMNRYADKELPELSLASMQQHSAECSACRSRLKEIHRLSAILAADLTPDVPPGFAESVMRKARSVTRVRPAPFLWFRPAWWDAMTQPVRVAATALLVLGLGLGAYMGWDISQTRKLSVEVVKLDPSTQYGLDFFEAAPAGSLEQVYLDLAE